MCYIYLIISQVTHDPDNRINDFRSAKDVTRHLAEVDESGRHYFNKALGLINPVTGTFKSRRGTHDYCVGFFFGKLRLLLVGLQPKLSGILRNRLKFVGFSETFN